ncbi:DUF1513 domain-containing protein [Roseivivax sp. CAU 1753]
MDRRSLLIGLSALATTSLTGCDTGSGHVQAPDVTRGAHTWSAIYVPGYALQGVVPENEPADSRRRRQRAEQGTLLTRIAPDGTVRQAAFPVIGHDVAISPDGRVGFFGRMGYKSRGSTAHHVIFDPETLEMIGTGRPPGSEWRGGGHGVFLPEGPLLTTERAPMAAYSGRPEAHHGRLSLRDPMTLREIASISSHGIDPHEVRLLPDGRHVAVANYGSVAAEGDTRLSAPRRVVAPSVTVIDIASGALVDAYRTDDPDMELRHIALGAEGRILGIRARLAPEGADRALQRDLGDGPKDITAEGATAFLPAAPLLFHAGAQDGQPLAQGRPEAELRHGLSVEYDPRHDEFIASFPSSHRLMVFDGRTGRLRHSIDTRAHGLRYPCGIALLPGQDLYAVAGFWENLLMFRRGTHRPERALSHRPLLYGHSHMTAW